MPSAGDRDLCGEPFQTRRRGTGSHVLLGVLSGPHHAWRPGTRLLRGIGFAASRARSTGERRPSRLRELTNRISASCWKIKHERDCDCVVAGFRWHKDRGTECRFAAAGAFRRCRRAAARWGVRQFYAAEAARAGRIPEKRDLTVVLVDHPWRGWAELGAGEQRMPGGQSRWSQGKDLSWEPLRAELVVEVAYEHMQGSQFRHMAQFRRWRADKKPGDCTYARLVRVPPQELAEIFARGR